MTQSSNDFLLVAVRGSATVHYARDGGYLTVCGRIAVVRRHIAPGYTVCRRCAAGGYSAAAPAT